MLINNLPEKIELINKNLENKPKQDKDELYKKLDLELLDINRFFQLNSIESLNSNYGIDLSMWVYNKLKSWDRTTLTDRIILLQIFEYLIKKNLKDRLA